MMDLYFWDIETSAISCDNGEEIQVTYLSNVLKMDMTTGEYSSQFFRTIRDTVEYFKTLPPSIVYAHNLDYELTFLMRDLDNTTFAKRVDKYGNQIIDDYGIEATQCVFRDKNSPLQVVFNEIPNIRFKDSYALFNKSVKSLGEILNLPKLDYNYKVTRLPWDKLEPLDYEYNQRDNEIVALSMFNYMKDNDIKDIELLPMTFTSAIRQQREKFINSQYGKKVYNNMKYYSNIQYEDYNFYNLATKVYQGGLTTSNYLHTGEFIERDMYSIDIKSSYPYQMCSKHFPQFTKSLTQYYKGVQANIFFNKYGKGGSYLGVFSFINVKVKNDKYLLSVSTSQMMKYDNNFKEQNIVTFNGKLYSADVVLLPMNEVDMIAFNLVYDYDMLQCEELYYTPKKRRLAECEVSFLLNLFDKKESLPKDTPDYIQSKQAINGQYGIKVTSPIRPSYIEVDGQIVEVDYYSFGIDKQEEIYNNHFSSIPIYRRPVDVYTDGVYITSYARLQLISKMVELVDKGCTVVYSDTDSIKFYCDNIEEIHKELEEGNKNTIEVNKNSLRFIQYKERFQPSEVVYNKICKLGIWELENFDNPYTMFITYGAKKYAYIDNEGIHSTIAGCNKKLPSKAITNFANKSNMTLGQALKFILVPGTVFDTSVSGRTVSYKETREKEEMKDWSYKGKFILQYGGIIIKDTTYTLDVSDKDKDFLNLFQDIQVMNINIEGDVY